MEANKYLLTAATLAGIAAGSISTAVLTARAGVPMEHRICVDKELGDAAANTLESFLDNQVCATVNTALGIDDCSASDFRAGPDPITIRREVTTDKWVINVCPVRQGTWVVGEPE